MVRTMNIHQSLNWPLITFLGALAMIRPVSRIVGNQLSGGTSPALPITMTLVVSVIWVLIVGMSRVERPVATLVLAGLTYAVFAIILSAILSPILSGQLQGPIANPAAIIPILTTNALWGAVAGGLALLVQRGRGIRSGDS